MEVVFYLTVILFAGVALYAVAINLSRTNARKYLFASGCLLTIYLLYLIACAAVMGSGFLLYVLPFFGRMNANGLGLLIQWTGALSLLTWILWALDYCRGSDKKGDQLP